MDERRWMLKINEELNQLPDASQVSTHWSKLSIYRIPTCVADINKRAYKPQMVSFGPYHNGLEHLRAMEEHKRRALLHFLKRSKEPLQSFVDALVPLVDDLREAYDQLDPKWEVCIDDFLEMMIVDGCFMLEILRSATSQFLPDGIDDYASNDPIFSKHGNLYVFPYLRRDMLMLENQLPMLLLHKLISISKDDSFKQDWKDLSKRILRFFFQPITTNHILVFSNSLHILDMYRQSLLVVERKHKQMRRPSPIEYYADDIVLSAIELMQAGISIQRSSSRSLNDISFRDGVLRLPMIVVDDVFESVYLNLIALERFHVGAGNEITSYIFFMENIINSARDVALLHGHNVIQNALGSDKAVANLFNTLCKDITLDPDSVFDQVRRQVNAYCQNTIPRWRALFVRACFTNPLGALSVIAFFFNALTIVQTVYAVLDYIKRS